jgi:hypothetical protein
VPGCSIIYNQFIMKSLIKSTLLLACIGQLACEKENTPDPYTSVTISMGANSVSDVYYNLADGSSSSVNRSDWDIAFSVPTQSATVLINEGAGVELYCVGDTNYWESVDENTIEGLQPRFNDKTGWTVGAFNQNFDQTDVFNFGWGHYNMSDHNVYGDSIYVIKLTDGTYRKFFYRERIGATAVHYLEWANLDGSDPVNAQVVATSYVGTRNFIHYSLVNQEIVEAEPLNDQWDLLFTRYVLQIPAGPGLIMNYTFTGVLSKAGVTVAKVKGLPPSEAMDTDAEAGYSGNADAIGYDWKVSDPGTHEISLVDSVSYFVKSVDGTKHQLYFTGYGGNTAGTIDLKVKTVE